MLNRRVYHGHGLRLHICIIHHPTSNILPKKSLGLNGSCQRPVICLFPPRTNFSSSRDFKTRQEGWGQYSREDRLLRLGKGC